MRVADRGAMQMGANARGGGAASSGAITVGADSVLTAFDPNGASALSGLPKALHTRPRSPRERADAVAERLRQLSAERLAQRGRVREAQLAERRRLVGEAAEHLRLEFLPLSKLRPGAINRDINESLVWDIALDFEWESFQVMVVEDADPEGDGTHEVREAHHRYWALTRLFGATEPDKLVPCAVIGRRGTI